MITRIEKTMCIQFGINLYGTDGTKPIGKKKAKEQELALYKPEQIGTTIGIPIWHKASLVKKCFAIIRKHKKV